MDLLRVKLTDMAHQGAAVGRVEGQVVFAYYGLPGEEVMVAVDARRRNYLTGRVAQVLDPSPARAFPPCPYFGDCGGCQWQHATYAHQLELKRHILSEQLRRVGGLLDLPMEGVLPSPRIWHYHNHARLVSDAYGQLGFRRLSANEVVPINFCWIMDLRIGQAISQLQHRSHEPGQEVIVRVGQCTGDWLLQPRQPLADPPSGQEHLEEELAGRRYRISAQAFFQVNTLQAERLVELVTRAVDPQPGDHLLDLYGGVGTLGLALAEKVRRVTIVEEHRAALEDARYNATGLDNVRLLAGRVEDVFGRLHGRVDCVVVDPPRAGLAAAATRGLLALAPSRVAYVSCDPATLARDLRLLNDGGYEVTLVQPLDMFPQTYHIETLAALRRR